MQGGGRVEEGRGIPERLRGCVHVECGRSFSRQELRRLSRPAERTDRALYTAARYYTGEGGRWKVEVSVKVPRVSQCGACVRVHVAPCCALLTALRIHMPTHGHRRLHRHTQCVLWSAWLCRAHSTPSAGVCMWSVGAICFARRELTRTVASSGAHRPRTTLRELPPRSLAHTFHACTRTFRCGPLSVQGGRGFAGIPERLCSAAGPSSSQFP